MCFSAEASLITGVSLSILGAFAIKKAEKRVLIPFATIPLLFGIQQLVEGFIWVNLQHWHSEQLKHLLTYAYLTFVFGVWPIFCSFVCFTLEKNKIRRMLMIITLLLGISIALHAIMFMVDSLSTATIIYHSIAYQTHTPECTICLIGIYLSSTSLPFLISSYRELNFIGLLLLLSAIISYIVWKETFGSVWCFFAAVLSILVLFAVLRLKDNPAIKFQRQ